MESFRSESLIYLLVAGAIQVIGAMVLAVPLFVVAKLVSDVSIAQFVSAYLLFNLFLLFWGCLGHYLFLSFTLGKLYVSMDRVVDWFPFIPFGQWVLNQSLWGPKGHLIGRATRRQLQVLWATVAIPVWLLAFISTWISLHGFMGA